MALDHHEPLHILLIEQHPATRHQLQELLRDHALPITLHALARGAGPLSFFPPGGPEVPPSLPHVIFLDSEVLEQDGGLILAAITTDPAWRDIPVVLFSEATCTHAHLVAAGLVAASLTHSLGRGQCMKLMEQLLRRPQPCEAGRRAGSRGEEE
jgi:CheY-like chemotaxis protein